MEHELLRVRKLTHARILAERLQAIEQARQWFRLSMLTPEPCEALAASLVALQQAIQGAIADLDTPEILAEHRPYAVLIKLRPLHRMLIETLVVLAGVRGLCQAGRLQEDRTGMYWQCKQSLGEIRRNGEEMLRLLACNKSLAATA